MFSIVWFSAVNSNQGQTWTDTEALKILIGSIKDIQFFNWRNNCPLGVLHGSIPLSIIFDQHQQPLLRSTGPE
jgi:hypothetical protein